MAKKVQPLYPSFFGSHSSMIDEEETAKLNDPKLVVLKDEDGFYTTERNRLDTKMADPNRYPTARLDRLFKHGKKKDAE